MKIITIPNSRRDRIITLDVEKYKEFPGVKEVFTYWSTKGRKKTDYLNTAFLHYINYGKEPEKTEMEELVEHIIAVKKIGIKYNIKSKKDLNTLLKSEAIQVQELPEEKINLKRWTLSLAQLQYERLYLRLKKMDSKEKVLFVIDVISNYWKTGLDEDYNRLKQIDLLNSLVFLYKEANKESRRNEIVQEILAMINAPIQADEYDDGYTKDQAISIVKNGERKRKHENFRDE